MLSLQTVCPKVGVSAKNIHHWVEVILSQLDKKQMAVTIRLVDEAEITALNQNYRHQNKATNVLAFPCEIASELKLNLLGDIIICPSIVKKQAKTQQKTIKAHLAHMVVHGLLHLLGFDHEKTKARLEMERLEIKLLKQLGFANPYCL